ncbi:MAG: reverse transcriptase-like protein [Anaerolineales bacterium]|nr:reverse transcriptase-like protein [Anaerolineales bacterium]
MTSSALQALLEAIAALPEVERQDLLARLRERYGVPPPPPPARQMGLGLEPAEWREPADFLLVFDGGSLGNPGPGYGSYALFEGGRSGQAQRVNFPDPMTNNEAEYHTLLAALRDLLGRLGERAGGSSLEVRGDSALVIQQVLGAWKAKDERMRRLRDEARRLLRRFARYRLVQQPREDTVRVLGH